jgi:hypothetical protein
LNGTDRSDLLDGTVKDELTDAQRKTMIEVGEAFYRIREQRLFRENYPNFEEYVRRRVGSPIEFAELAIEFYLASRN